MPPPQFTVGLEHQPSKVHVEFAFTVFQGSAFHFQAVLVTGATEVQGRKVTSCQNYNGSGKPEQKERLLTRCATFTALHSPHFAFLLL